MSTLTDDLLKLSNQAIRKGKGQQRQIRILSSDKRVDIAVPHGSDDQLFHIASIGKLFTAVSALRLVEK